MDIPARERCMIDEFPGNKNPDRGSSGLGNHVQNGFQDIDSEISGLIDENGELSDVGDDCIRGISRPVGELVGGDMDAGGGTVELLEDGSNEGTVSLDQGGVKLEEEFPALSGSISPVSKFSEEKLVAPHEKLPPPKAPSGMSELAEPLPEMEVRGQSEKVRESPIVKFLRDRSISLPAVILQKFPALQGSGDDQEFDDVRQFDLTGLKVVVQLKGLDEPDMKGRVTFFSRSACRDCTAVRVFFHERNLQFVEINIDVYPERMHELVERTGSKAVPAIFFNEKFVGSLVALNSLRNSGQFEKRLVQMTYKRCPPEAPVPPVYGFDEPEEVQMEEERVLKAVRALRQRLPIQDVRLVKAKLVRNFFTGSDAVDVLLRHLEFGRNEAVEVGRELAQKHFFHHVFQENEFEDGHQHLYRFVKHEPCILSKKCFNFRGCTNDREVQPKPASQLTRKLTKIMIAIVEAYTSADGRHVDYTRIGSSEEFRRYVNVVEDLQRVDLTPLSVDERMMFFMNLYNAMVIHEAVKLGRAEGPIDRRMMSSDFQYIIGGYPYSLSTIKNGILRCNRRAPYSLGKPFGTGDKRMELVLPKLNPLIHFGLFDGTRSSPKIRFYSTEVIETELRAATREFFQEDGMQVNLEKRSVHIPRIMKWYNGDFAEEKEVLNWVLSYLDSSKAGLLTHLLNDGGHINIVYSNHDWSLNSLQ